ncbi:Alpha/beta hydrolase, N-terminal, partial [Cynara cardunculus var. scolymus]
FQEYIRNSRGVQLFTCKWLPVSPPKALVFLCHGCGTKLASYGYAVFGIDYEGHGRSMGARCYIKKFDHIVADCSNYFKYISGQEDYKNKRRFLYGESMGGAVSLLISEKVKPHPMVISMLTRVEDVIPRWKIVPTKDVIDSAFKDPIKREEVRLIFAIGEFADTVTDPEVSRALYEQASSKDKTIKLYPGMWHGLTSGEPDQNIDIVFSDIISWLDKRCDDDYITDSSGAATVIDDIELVPSPMVEISKKKLRQSGSYLCGWKGRRMHHHSAM